MARYSDEIINEIFAQNDIVDYVSSYVHLKKNGKDYTGLCPFHKEKSPSFHVNQEKQLFHCFGCGAGGNLIQFVMRSEGLDFLEALKLMADKAGIILPEDDISYDDGYYQKKKRILSMNKTAARFYYELLTKDESGKAGLKYFTDRKIDHKTITNYGLGFAPDSFDRLKSYMNKLAFSDDELVEAGLCGNKNGRIYDKFRNRVIFPIIDLRGNVIAFGGRRIEDNSEKQGYSTRKYLNSSDTPVFNKGKNLFSLNLAKKTSDMQCILCEGYMDVISVYKAGVQNIVATLGTALTEDQAKLLLKYTNEILLCYDSDEAGQAATKRAIDIISLAGGRCKVMQLKNSKDPDEYINKNGIAMFKNVMKDALPATDYLIRQERQKFNLDTTDGKILFIEETAKILAKIHNAVEIDAYVKKISDETDVSKDAIYAEIKKLKSEIKLTDNKVRAIKVLKTDNQQQTEMYSDAEMKLLSLIVESKSTYLQVRDNFTENDFSTELLRKLAKMIYSAYDTNDVIDCPLILNSFSGKDADVVSNIFCNIERYTNEKNTIIQLVNSIKLSRVNEQIETAKKENDVLKLKELLDLRLKLKGNNENV